MSPDGIDRRAFLAAGYALLLAGATGCGAYRGAHATENGETPRPGDGWIAVGPVAGLLVDAWRPRRVNLHPQLGRDGVEKVFIRLDGARQDRVVALSARCPHLACPVDYVQSARRFICPCHGGVLRFDGRPSGGPVKRPLDSFETLVRNRVVYLGRRIEEPGPGYARR